MTTEPEASMNQLTGLVVGAAIEVHRTLGPGFLESVYEHALSTELALRGIPHRRQVEVGVDFKGIRVGRSRIDLLVAERLIVEIKAVDALAGIHRAQLISYLRSFGASLGLLLNFNVPLMKSGIQRVVLSA